ncbi:hypothetical protein [Psychrobacillus soli]|uniref:Uncharacterized protein n=1 Tax=Psychrobacillus soli TaxID=1543965 RepID=A0A544SZI7_9BACI|nr:hypothetical protein [Psychrobacillus soli]TQR10616.1 hypothetical protein FG383_14940 [Psychrobacillus soli]
MESLIIFVIIGIISALFGKKKPEQKNAPKQVKKVSPQKPFAENPFKNLGELAKEFKQQQQAELERRMPVMKEEPVVAVPVEKAQREVSRNQGVPRSSGRLSVYQGNRPDVNATKPVIAGVLPETKDELVRAIILSEILAPPKSKR